MNILADTTPVPNADRRARWAALRAAFPNMTSAERLISTAVRPVTRINLATSNEPRPGGLPFFCRVLGAAFGMAVWLGLAMFGLPAVLRVLLEEVAR